MAAGNPPEYNKSVREFDIVTLDRVKKISVEADFPVWKEFAYEQKIHGAIISYLEIRQENFCRIETTVDGKRFVTPRGWQDLSEMLYVYEELGITIDQEVVGQYLAECQSCQGLCGISGSVCEIQDRLSGGWHPEGNLEAISD